MNNIRLILSMLSCLAFVTTYGQDTQPRSTTSLGGGWSSSGNLSGYAVVGQPVVSSGLANSATGWSGTVGFVMPEVTVEEELANDLKSVLEVYPNPINDNLNISYDKPFTYQLIDMMGRKIHVNEKLSNEKRLTLDVSELESGLYLLNLEMEGKTISWKLFKE